MSQLETMMEHSAINSKGSEEVSAGNNGNERRKFRVQMNSCFICNFVFVLENKFLDTDNDTGFGGSSGNAKTSIGNLCNILDVFQANGSIAEETNPFCTKCITIIEEYSELERQLQFLIKLLWEMRKLLGKKVVQSYPDTPTNRKNFTAKTKIYEVWNQTSDNLPPRMNNLRFDITDSQKSFAEIITSSTSQPPNCSDSRLESAHTLLDISDRVQSTTNSETNRLSPTNSALHDESGSLDCPSPSSPPEFINDDPEHLENLSTNGDDGNHLSGVDSNEPQGTIVAEEASQTSKIVQTQANHNAISTTNAPASETVNNRDPLSSLESEGNEQSKSRLALLNIKTHRRTHACRFCGKLFPSNFSLQEHVRSHTGEKPFSCSTCGRPFISKAKMQKHEMTHDRSRYEGEPQYECDLCGKKYHLRLSLYTHKRDHMGIKRWKKYKPRGPNDPPRRKYKKKRKPKPIKPPKEPKPRAPRKRKERLDADGNPIPRRERKKRLPPSSDKPKRKSYRLYAPRRKPGVPVVPYSCSHCGKEFKYMNMLKCHILIHTGEKPHQCPLCEKKFALKGNLDKHMKYHDKSKYEKEPTHICDFCGKAFYVVGTLYHHRRKHHLGMGDKYRANRAKLRMQMKLPGKCKICGIEFEKKSYIRHHMLCHQEKRFKCSICEKPFHQSKDAMEHANSHDSTNLRKTLFKYQCIGCPPEALGFSSKLIVRDHWASCHSDQPVPEQYKKPPKKPKPPLPPGPGQIFCTKCPETCRPQYRHMSSLRKHMKYYHNPNQPNKRWKPNGEKGKHRKTIHEYNDSTSESESDEGEFKSDEESENGKDSKNMAPSRATPRQDVTHKTYLTRRLRGKDSKSVKGFQDSIKPRRGALNSKSKKPILEYQKELKRKENEPRRHDSKFTPSYIRSILKGREMRLVLQRIGETSSSRPGTNDTIKLLDSRRSPAAVAPILKAPFIQRRGQLNAAPLPTTDLCDTDVKTEIEDASEN